MTYTSVSWTFSPVGAVLRPSGRLMPFAAHRSEESVCIGSSLSAKSRVDLRSDNTCMRDLPPLVTGCGRLMSPAVTHAAASANDVAIILFMSFLLSVFLPSWQPAQQPDNLASTPRIISHPCSKKIALYNFFLDWNHGGMASGNQFAAALRNSTRRR